jgi:hypothetical protein
MDRTDVKKALNEIKATVERRRGPAEKSQDAAPIADAMRDYWDRGMLSFSIPAHSGGRGPAPEFAAWAGIEAARFDLPMSHGVDTRDRAWPAAKSAPTGTHSAARQTTVASSLSSSALASRTARCTLRTVSAAEPSSETSAASATSS